MWPNTISARALVNAIQRAHKAWRRYSDYFIWSMPSLSVLFFFIIEHSVFMALLFYQKCFLEKVTMKMTHMYVFLFSFS